jgi:hypothetical protein
LRTRSTGTVTVARFAELTGASCENGIPGGKVVMLIRAKGHSLGDGKLAIALWCPAIVEP